MSTYVTKHYVMLLCQTNCRSVFSNTTFTYLTTDNDPAASDIDSRLMVYANQRSSHHDLLSCDLAWRESVLLRYFFDLITYDKLVYIEIRCNNVLRLCNEQ